MEIKLFSDLIDALGKVANGFKTIANLPKNERAAMRRALDETFRLIDTTLNMVIIRLGDTLLQTSDVDFLQETARLNNSGEWMQAEREFRLCQSLRVAVRDTETLAGRLKGAVSIKDWDALLEQMHSILATEGAVAEFIGQRFGQVSNQARLVMQNAQGIDSLREALGGLRDALVAERQILIKQEIGLYNSV